MENPLFDAISDGLRRLPPVDHFRIDESLHRMQWNENPSDFPSAFKEEVLNRVAQMDWARYPVMMRPFDLIDRIAGSLHIPPDRIVVSGGSADLIRIVLAAIVQPGDAVVIPSPTFLLYKRNLRILSAELHEVRLQPDEDFALPVEETIAAAHRLQARAIMLCAPNNPTGTLFSAAAIETIARECGCALVVDEAYLEFSGQDLLPLTLRNENVLLLRTFSKAYSMAGVRVGYAIADEAVAGELQKAVASFPISIFQEAAAITAIAHREEFLKQVTRVVYERERLASALRDLPGMTVFSSATNFLLVRPPVAANALFEHLLREHRILISDASGYPELTNYLRITVGTPEQNDCVVQGFREYLLRESP